MVIYLCCVLNRGANNIGVIFGLWTTKKKYYSFKQTDYINFLPIAYFLPLWVKLRIIPDRRHFQYGIHGSRRVRQTHRSQAQHPESHEPDEAI